MRAGGAARRRYFVMTRWRDEAAFTGWISSPAFADQHARAASHDGKPVAAHSELLSFEVVSKPPPLT